MKYKIHGLLLALIIIIADQVSKWWMVSKVLLGTKSPIIDFVSFLTLPAKQMEYAVVKVTSFLNFVMVWNPGVSFGLLQTNKQFVVYALSAMAVLVSIGFIVWLWRDARPIRAVTVGLIVGGALGNVWDRLRFGAVVDFIDLHVAGFHWPAFNIADSAITIGIFIVLYEIFFLSPTKLVTEKK